MKKNIPLADATPAQMRAFASSYLGVEFSDKDRPEKMRAKIAQAWGQNEIMVEVADEAEGDDSPAPAAVKPPIQATPVQPMRDGGGKGEPKVKLLIHEQEGAGGKRPVYVGVNGTGMLIPRGQIVEVAYRYYHALANAVRDVYDQDDEGTIHKRQVPAYPFQVHALPSQAELDAWAAGQTARAA